MFTDNEHSDIMNKKHLQNNNKHSLTHLTKYKTTHSHLFYLRLSYNNLIPKLHVLKHCLLLILRNHLVWTENT